jgi:hypothetical protein
LQNIDELALSRMSEPECGDSAGGNPSEINAVIRQAELVAERALHLCLTLLPKSQGGNRPNQGDEAPLFDAGCST